MLLNGFQVSRIGLGRERRFGSFSGLRLGLTVCKKQEAISRKSLEQGVVILLSLWKVPRYLYLSWTATIIRQMNPHVVQCLDRDANFPKVQCCLNLGIVIPALPHITALHDEYWLGGLTPGLDQAWDLLHMIKSLHHQ